MKLYVKYAKGTDTQLLLNAPLITEASSLNELFEVKFCITTEVLINKSKIIFRFFIFSLNLHPSLIISFIKFTNRILVPDSG